MVSASRGRSSLGCLIALLLLTAAGYFGVNIGEPYWRFYRFQDAMQQEARFAEMRSDSAIARRLASAAESLGLPDAAGHVTVQRDARARRIVLSASYAERVELPGYVRTFKFEPRASSSY